MATVTDIDRRWVFLIMGLVVLITYIGGVAKDLPVSEYVDAYYKTIEDLPAGSVVMLSADFDPASAAELLPMYQATIHHLLRRDIRIVNVATWPAAPPYTRRWFDQIAPQYGKVYGTDWLELGFLPGDDVAMGQIGGSITSAFAEDARENKPITDFPLTAELSSNMGGIVLLVSLSAGYPGILEWIAQVGGRYDVPILTGTTAVQTPDLYAYYPSQCSGFLGAATGATQYLQLVTVGETEVPDDPDNLATVRASNQRRMFVQSWAHGILILLIIVGNVLYFRGRSQTA